MYVSLRADHAVRAVTEIAVASAEGRRMTCAEIASAQEIPLGSLQGILGDLRRATIVIARGRGPRGGYELLRSPTELSIVDVMRAVEGQPGTVHGVDPRRLAYPGPAEPLTKVWAHLYDVIASVVNETTIADLLGQPSSRPLDEDSSNKR